jgi:hypothetical protein
MTPTFAPAPKVHAQLARGLGPTLTRWGWVRQSGRSCAFARPRAGRPGQWVLWVQVSQWGSADLGSEFTLNLERQQDPLVHPGTGPDSRILAALGSTDREQALAVETRIVARKPRPAADRQIHQHLLRDKTGMLREAWDKAFMPQPERWRSGGDPWLTYFSVADVNDWAEFLSERLAHVIELRMSRDP